MRGRCGLSPLTFAKILGSFLLLFAGASVTALDLPPEAKRDMYVMQLAEHLKAERWREAYPLFQKIQNLTDQHGLAADHSVLYFHGETAFQLEEYRIATEQLGNYVRSAGSQGSFYTKALAMLGDIEDLSSTKAEEYYRKAKGSDLLVDADNKPLGNWLALYHKAAELGHAKAQARLGDLYWSGVKGGIVNQDYEKALDWYRAAAEGGLAGAFAKLARAYQYGYGAEKDPREALRLYEKSATLGNAEAMFDLAMMYMHGDSTVKNPELAISWLRKAADNQAFKRKALALAHIGSIYEGCCGNDQPDFTKARHYYIEATRLGKNFARFYLAKMYEDGRGGPKNLAEAVRLYGEIWDTRVGHEFPAAERLAYLHEQGIGVEQDFVIALDWYQKSGNGGGPKPRLRIAEFYEEGRPGVPQNLQKALEIYSDIAGDKRLKNFKTPQVQEMLESARKGKERLTDAVIREYLESQDSSERVERTASGLRYQVLEKGQGTTRPQLSDKVSVYYTMGLLDDPVIVGSKEKSETFEVGNVLAGFAEGLQMMVAGDRMRLFAPPDLGYGDRSRGKFPAHSMIVYDVEMLGIVQ